VADPRPLPGRLALQIIGMELLSFSFSLYLGTDSPSFPTDLSFKDGIFEKIIFTREISFSAF